MKMNMFLLLTSWALLLGEGHCLDNSSPATLLVPSDAIRNIININWKDIHNKISRDFQSHFKLEELQKNRKQPCTVKLEASERSDTFKLQFQRNSVTHACKFSEPLHLDHNGLGNLSPDVLDKLKKFAGLLLEHNNLDSLNVTISQDSDFLETLKLDNNNLFALSRQIFHDLKDLKTITLNANNFSAIPLDLFHHNKRLKTIELTQNKARLTELPPRLFSDLVDLKVVLLRNIGLRRLPEDLFWGSHNLKEIDLSNNDLRSLPKNLLRDAHELRIFNVSSNTLIFSLPSGMFVAANQLNQLDLSNNFISFLDRHDVFAGLQSLQTLNMANNCLTDLDRDVFIALPNLRIVNFSGNEDLTVGAEIYDCFGREISVFHNSHLLEELHVSGTRISTIYSDWIFNHTKLSKLDLSRNKLMHLRTDDLRFNSSNLYVDLSHNYISRVNLTEVGRIPKKANSSRNVTVNLNWNPIYCNCDIYSLVRYVMNETSDWIKPEDLNYVKLLTDNLYCGCDFNQYTWGKRISQLAAEVLTCGVYEPSERLGSSCPYNCSCQIIPKFSMLKIDCHDYKWNKQQFGTWHIDFAYVDLSNNSLHRIPDITRAGLGGARELYLDVSANQIDRIEDHSLAENLRGLVLDGNNLTKADMEIVKLKAPKVITERIREIYWPCDAAIAGYQKYAINCFILKKPIIWEMKDFVQYAYEYKFQRANYKFWSK